MSTPIVSMSWSTKKNGAPWGNPNSGSTFSFTPDGTGNYTITFSATDAAGGTNSVDTAIVADTPPSSPPMTLSPITVLNTVGGQPTTFSVQVAGGTSPFTASWSFGDEAVSIISSHSLPHSFPNPNSLSAVHTYKSTGQFLVSVRVVDATGQSVTASVTVVITQPPPIVSVSGAPASGHVLVGSTTVLTGTATQPFPGP